MPRWRRKSNGAGARVKPERTYLDSCLLIAAFLGKGEVGRRAMEILDDPKRHFVVSDAVRLEVMPKPRH